MTDVDDGEVSIGFQYLLKDEFDDLYISSNNLPSECESASIKCYSYDHDALRFKSQY
ncbi:hypothetical protein HASA104033_11530 [Halobacterium salinarum]|uniref:DUF7961 domain-containing protein n=1 Tax=Halobacterium salinarum (strain ATCC 33171 / DSM 3754 / JCM 8978 / NBRC 102687 / NCIMB 764 / 91-R6) TaxID=2597657 RepID=A0A663A5Q9_HALS9|nr:hypothetical protein APQ99_02369 [Halobacterium salinarum DSM 3754]